MAIQPRPEAKPLPYEDLTDEQHSAGKKATELIHAMGHEQDSPWPVPPKEHSYVPAIDKSRTNRVILLDGARGSGKSALLVTLVDAYVRNLIGAPLAKGYKKWIRPEDRVVPVGLIDLQPLPSPQHLMLYLLSSLERVVEAMEPRHEAQRAPSAPWHFTQPDELESRKLWRRFAHVASMGWNSNLSERKGHLDPEAFAVELQEGELLRLDVVTVFRKFVDALVADYRRWRHWESGTEPLFLLAVDDADMNSELSAPLLELLRTLWHPRLTFLLTGDTKMFIDGVMGGDKTVEEFFRRVVQSIPDVSARDDDMRRRELKVDVYDKIIPHQHRCELRPLPVGERLKVGPNIGASLFRKILVGHVVSAPSGRKVTLEDCFTADPQVQELLPDRLRRLYELKAFIQQSDEDEVHEKRTAGRTIERIWEWVINRLPTSSKGLRPLIRIDEAGMLRVSGEVPLGPVLTSLQKIELSSGWSLEIVYPARFEPSPPPKIGEEDLMKPLVAVLMLATDYAALASDAEFVTRSPAPSGLVTPLLAQVVWRLPASEGNVVFPWPTPEWESFADFRRLTEEWRTSLSLAASQAERGIESMAKAFLRCVLRVGLGESKGDDSSVRQESFEWSALAADLARVSQLAADRRQRALAEWCLGRAGLLAAPESGLPPEAANRFLEALRSALGHDWARVRSMLRQARQARVVKRIKDDSIMNYGRDTLRDIDEKYPRHQFSRFLEDNSNVSAEDANRFRSVLSRVIPRWFDRVKVPKSEGLAVYLSSLRLTWLQQTPSQVLRAMQNAMASLDKVYGASQKSIELIWQAAVEAAEEEGLKDVVRAFRTEIHIRKEYWRLAYERASLGAKKQNHAYDARKNGGLKCQVWKVEGSASPILLARAQDGSEKALEVVFRVAYDSEQDRRGAGTEWEGAEPRWWAGVEIQLDGEYNLRPWPVPAWQTLREWEELEPVWNSVVERVERFLSRDDIEGDPRVLDALAYWFIVACDSLSRWGDVSGYINIDVEKNDWSRAHGNIQDFKHQARAGILSRWMNQLVVLGTPESGLSEDAARAMLDRHFSSPLFNDWENAWRQYQKDLRKHGAKRFEMEDVVGVSVDVHEVWKNLARMRRKRLEDAGVAPEQVDALLAKIDGEVRDEHPWIERFGKWSENVKP